MADYDPANSSMWVHRKKGSESGRFYLLPVEATAVRAWVKKRGVLAGPLFPSRKQTPISRDQIHDMMRRYSVLAGIPQESAHPHALKHSCGTHVLARVKDLSIVQKWLGHRSIASTEIYAKVLGQALQEATASFGTGSSQPSPHPCICPFFPTQSTSVSLKPSPRAETS
jgi:type 1 fimbriae regulatory protein FimB